MRLSASNQHPRRLSRRRRNGYTHNLSGRIGNTRTVFQEFRGPGPIPILRRNVARIQVNVIRVVARCVRRPAGIPRRLPQRPGVAAADQKRSAGGPPGPR